MSMKRRLGLALVLFASIMGCKEIPPPIDFSEPILLARDTTYVTTDIPTNPEKSVLIEDISGVKCNNCPKAADVAHDVQKKNPGRVVVLTLHSTDFAVFTAPYSDSRDTFNTEESTQIVRTLHQGNVAGLPTGGVDRKVFDGETQSLIPYTTWEARVNEQLDLKAKATLDLELIKEAGRRVIANVKTTFTEADATPVYMSVFIVESHILSKQKMPDNSFNPDFEHNSILREGVTTFSGIKLADNVEAGRVFEKGFTIDIPEKYVMEDCSVVVLINKQDEFNKEVVQCAEEFIGS
ncbi:MAG: Omp28-related outer membrane protein [Bacteroidia bacterium]|nr:Omp28-related outer membrane protein [Bacteroidia bacterium]